VGLIRVLLHDVSKFLPSEWINYSTYFYGKVGKCKLEKFNYSLIRHQRRNPHHWEYWLLAFEGNKSTNRPLRMPESCAREMVLDWITTGMVKSGFLDIERWYSENKGRMLLHADTRVFIENTMAFIIYGGNANENR
jgi:hypothetical protein